MNVDTTVRCKHCGHRGNQHGQASNPHRPYACPASDREPRWPHSIKDEKRAGEVFDAALAAHWTKLTTTFQPCI